VRFVAAIRQLADSNPQGAFTLDRFQGGCSHLSA